MKVTVQIENPELQGKVKFKIHMYRLRNLFVKNLFEKKEPFLIFTMFPTIFSNVLYVIFNLQMLKLQAAIKYGEEDLAGAKSLVDQCPNDDPDTDINRGM